MKYSEEIKEQAILSISKISNLEQRMICGDKSITMFDLMSETHKLLSLTKPIVKPHNQNTHQNLY
jgi:hypothetical protein